MPLEGLAPPFGVIHVVIMVEPIALKTGYCRQWLVFLPSWNFAGSLWSGSSEREEVSMGLGLILFGSSSGTCCSAAMVDCSTASTSQKRFKLDFRLLSSRDRYVDCGSFLFVSGVRPEIVQPRTVACSTGKLPGRVRLPD